MTPAGNDWVATWPRSWVGGRPENNSKSKFTTSARKAELDIEWEERTRSATLVFVTYKAISVQRHNVRGLSAGTPNPKAVSSHVQGAFPVPLRWRADFGFLSLAYHIRPGMDPEVLRREIGGDLWATKRCLWLFHFLRPLFLFLVCSTQAKPI